MKRACLLCDRIAPESALFCQELECQAERAPLLLSYGDRLGDVEVVRPLIVLRSAVIYTARHGAQPVLLKVAHPAPHHEARLLREAELLRTLQQAKPPHPGLPTLLPPYTNATIAATPVGQAMLADQLVHYTLLAHTPGEPLLDLLKKFPQLWVYHVGWITAQLAAAVTLLHGASRLHLALGPECVLVHFSDQSDVPRITLLDFGAATPLQQRSDGQHYTTAWYPAVARPAGTAPELLAPPLPDGGVNAGPASDVYGIGLVLYELLGSAPPFPRAQLPEQQVLARVRAGQAAPLNRADVQRLANLALTMLSPDPAKRPADANQIVDEIKRTEIGTTPAERPSRWPKPSTIFAATAAVLLIAFLIALAVSLRAIFS